MLPIISCDASSYLRLHWLYWSSEAFSITKRVCLPLPLHSLPECANSNSILSTSLSSPFFRKAVSRTATFGGSIQDALRGRSGHAVRPLLSSVVARSSYTHLWRNIARASLRWHHTLVCGWHCHLYPSQHGRLLLATNFKDPPTLLHSQSLITLTPCESVALPRVFPKTKLQFRPIWNSLKW